MSEYDGKSNEEIREDAEFDERDEFNEEEFDTEDFDEDDEDISTEEVDRVLALLTGQMEKVESETIHEILDEAYNRIFLLVYEEEDADDDEDEDDLGDELNGELDDEFEDDDLEDLDSAAEAA